MVEEEEEEEVKARGDGQYLLSTPYFRTPYMFLHQSALLALRFYASFCRALLPSSSSPNIFRCLPIVVRSQILSIEERPYPPYQHTPCDRNTFSA